MPGDADQTFRQVDRRLAVADRFAVDRVHCGRHIEAAFGTARGRDSDRVEHRGGNVRLRARYRGPQRQREHGQEAP